VRILDLPAALQGRAYDSDADVVISVEDDAVPENAGLWRVAIADGKARVERAHGSSAAITLGVQELGAAYLGGVTLNSLARAGLVTENTPGAVHELSRAMVGAVAPVNNISF
jgi:predicted acetyltransferase